jgi:SAM-dependent methyltransferase
MLAPKIVPVNYQRWNAIWGSPFGHPNSDRLMLVDGLHTLDKFRLAGPFAFQQNNSTRQFEYPWVYDQIDHRRSSSLADVGAGLTGMQFVLSRGGHVVYSVDPGHANKAYAWGSMKVDMAQLNSAFHASVRPLGLPLEEADFAPGSLDYVLCLSTIEHLGEAAAIRLIQAAARVLRPGGRMICTVDLFLNLEPWTQRTTNRWGSNLNVADLISAEPNFSLVVGDRAQLLGFPEFNPSQILESLADYLVGDYPCLAQCFVLERADQ